MVKSDKASLFFQKFIQQNQEEGWFDKNNKLLVAVSGGMDSMALLRLLVDLEFDVGIAHVNYKLRERESDEDADFVKLTATSFNVPFHLMEIDGKAYADEKVMGIQQAARLIRYEFLEEILITKGYHFICTAHHLDDQFETMLYRFIKGSGLRGLSGIPYKRHNIVRPLLHFYRVEIKEFVEEMKMDYRFDSSNTTDLYARNYIRHQLLPHLDHIHPGWKSSMFEQNKILREQYSIYISSIKSYWEQRAWKENEIAVIDVEEIEKKSDGKSFLYELLSRLNCPNGLIHEIHSDIQRCKNGTYYKTEQVQLLLYRNKIYLKTIEDIPKYEITFKPRDIDTFLLVPGGKFEVTSTCDSEDDHTIVLQKEWMEQEFAIRTWQQGDAFQPLGMNGKSKKLSDYFTDMHINRFQRETIPLLLKGDKIIWIAGYRKSVDLEVASEKDQKLQCLRWIPDKVIKQPLTIF